MLRIIKHRPQNAAMNMALDETLFIRHCAQIQDKDPAQRRPAPVLRFYSWDGAYATIGYFQKNLCNGVRRITGGLTVFHKDDLSYGFISDINSWEHVYSEPQTYKILHTSIQKALLKINIACSFLPAKEGGVNNICVQTLYENDLIYKGEKVVGSCSRRRAAALLVQGSVHIKLDDAQKEIFQTAFAQELSLCILKSQPALPGALCESWYEQDLTEEELKQAEILAAEKYCDKSWNNKF
ncbi:MAG: hypothetical protein LBQ47_06815 [Endomicrobium sp.]|jgi:lipoate-protein ligase A|nr:hypothetical protein [Endomicrobium sp.]